MATFARGYWTRKVDHANQALHNSLDRQAQTSDGKITWQITAGDEATLRGIPAIGRGVRGVIQGTDPGNIRFD